MVASSQGKEKQVLPNVGEAANQPLDINYPKREFGKTKVVHRAIQAQWFAKWPWLHYDTAQDLAFCHVCHCSWFWKACIVDMGTSRILLLSPLASVTGMMQLSALLTPWTRQPRRLLLSW